MSNKEFHQKVLIIYSEPTLLTTDSVDPNIITLLVGTKGALKLSFLLRNDAVDYLVALNWKNEFSDSEYHASWEWISKQIGGNVYGILEDIKDRNIQTKDLDNGIKLISKDDVSALMNENHVIFVY
jgi:sulfur transfer complex TusBCD TusB component (DsrH family)|tara:strand:- start:183 stop:560 length:378 start_codon:yes stop_codon:yes gene_type:complete